MMSSVFLRVLDASFSGSVVILVILLLRREAQSHLRLPGGIR